MSCSYELKISWPVTSHNKCAVQRIRITLFATDAVDVINCVDCDELLMRRRDTSSCIFIADDESKTSIFPTSVSSVRPGGAVSPWCR